MTTIFLTSDTLLHQNPDILAAELGEETVMMSMAHNKYYGLDDVGSRIWALLLQPRTLAELCTTLQQEFEVDAETCEREVKVFVERLVNAGLVNVG